MKILTLLKNPCVQANPCTTRVQANKKRPLRYKPMALYTELYGILTYAFHENCVQIYHIKSLREGPKFNVPHQGHSDGG